MQTIACDTTWINAIEQRREELKIPKAALARRAGLSLSQVNRLFARRGRGPSLGTVQAIVNVMGLSVHVAEHIEVRSEIDATSVCKRVARIKADALIRQVQGTMALEGQAIDDDAREQFVQQTVEELLAGPVRHLWSE